MSVTKKLMAVLAATFAILLALASCSGGGSSADNSKNFIGDWKLVGMEENGEVSSEEDIAMLEAFGLSVGLTVNEDGTFSLDFFGEAMNGSWSAKGATEAEFTIEGQAVKATLADEKLSMEQDGVKLTFGKGKASSSSSGSSGSDSADAEDTVALGTVIADDEIATVVIVDKKTDSFGDPGYTIKVTNNSDAAISVSAATDQWSINGKMIDPAYYETIQPGKYAESFMYFSSDDVSSIDELSNVEGSLAVVNDKYETIATYAFHE